MLSAKEIRAQRARFLNEEVFDMYRLKLQRCKDCNWIFDLDSRTECRCWNRNWIDLFQ